MTRSDTTPSHASAEVARQRLLADLPVTERRIELAHIPTALLEAGEGPPIVLLHGPGEFAERWLRVITGLATTHRVTAPDFPGHGRSGTHRGQLDRDQVFRWLDALLDECCDRPPIVVGHILGGAVAARYAAARPNRLERLVLVDSLGLARFRPSPRFALGLVGFLARPTDRSHQRFMRQCLADDTTVRESMGDKWDALREYSLDRARDPEVKAAMKFFMSELGVPRIPITELEAITVPTSLVWGRHDRANRVRIAEDASERFGWSLHIIEGAADDPPMERPDEFVAAVVGN
ncbi:hypothetical protein BH20ACT6_BH20ACT6_04750 [soil metagenome]